MAENQRLNSSVAGRDPETQLITKKKERVIFDMMLRTFGKEVAPSALLPPFYYRHNISAAHAMQRTHVLLALVWCRHVVFDRELRAAPPGAGRPVKTSMRRSEPHLLQHARPSRLSPPVLLQSCILAASITFQPAQ
jgi:hypothetical protein